MGLLISNFLHYFQNKQDVRIVMVGLDGAGKTTILYRLKMGAVVSTTPTIGFNVEKVEYKNICFTVWDIGGQQRVRHLWLHYLYITSAIIFVVDSSDVQRLDEVKEELHSMMASETVDCSVLLVYANKQDMPNALSSDDLAKKLELHKVKQDWHVHETCATTGKGLYKGLDYLRDMLEKNKKEQTL